MSRYTKSPGIAGAFLLASNYANTSAKRCALPPNRLPGEAERPEQAFSNQLPSTAIESARRCRKVHQPGQVCHTIH
tara:strand:- start:25147 stop:25374 length:228 start_codon:yes stop_codon:yes gene_type:complete